LRSVTLQALLQNAYSKKAYQIIGPNWLGIERYDIIAKLPPDSTHEQVPLMLQTLLAERFSLQLHKEMREIPAYVLTTIKDRVNLKSVTGDSKLRVLPTGPKRRIHGQIGIPNLISVVASSVDKPIIDGTGLDGLYQVDLEWAPDTPLAAPAQPESSEPPLPNIFSALKAVGLRLEPLKEPVEVVVVDHANKLPTEN
jgi:uncharacterized protein (TIGR03435 family)